MRRAVCRIRATLPLSDSVAGRACDDRRAGSGVRSSAVRSCRRAEIAVAGPPKALAARDRADDPRQLVDAFGERGGPGLEDDRALDLVELVVDHRPHALPAGSAADLL